MGTDTPDKETPKGTTFDYLQGLDETSRRSAAWRGLVVRHHTRLRMFAAARLGEELRRLVDPEDVVNGAWMRVLRSHQVFRHRGRLSFYRWMCLQVVREVADQARQSKRSPLGKDLQDDLRTTAVGPEIAASDREALDMAVAALEQLPDQFRTPLDQVYLQLRPRNVVAADHGLTANALSQRLHRGMEAWKAALGRDPLEGM